MSTDYEDMTKDGLQDELAARGLSTSGNKDDLVARLELSDAEAEDPQAAAEAEVEAEVVPASEKAQRFTAPGFDPVAEKADPREDPDAPAEKEGRVEQAFDDVEELEPRVIDESQFGHLPPQMRPSAHNPDGIGGYEVMPDGRRRRLVTSDD